MRTEFSKNKQPDLLIKDTTCLKINVASISQHRFNSIDRTFSGRDALANTYCNVQLLFIIFRVVVVVSDGNDV